MASSAASSNSAKESATSATNAKTSETNAKTSEINAKESETKAEGRATAAKASADTATVKATESSNSSHLSHLWAESGDSPDGLEDADSPTKKTQSSKTWASFSKTKAEESSLSSTNAATSANTATEQARVATTKATESGNSASESSKFATSASISATNAKNSETNAANSEVNALQYKTSAEESKTSAATSATNASKSEVNSKASANSATSSASAAITSATNAKASETHAATSETNAKQALAESQKIQKEVEAALTKVTGFAKYVGSIDNYSDLPTSGNSVGNVWNIVNADATHQIKAGDNVIWNGENWDNLSGFVDLSNYPTNEDVAKTIVDTTYSGDTIIFIHKDGSETTATISDTSHSTQADQDGDGNVITLTYYKATDAAIVHQSFQNQINSKQGELTFDETPTANSDNPVKSKGVKTAIDTAVSTAKAEIEGKIPKVDATLSLTSENPVQNKVIKAELDGIFQDFTGATATTDGTGGKVPKPLAGEQNKVLKADGTWGDSVTPKTLWEGMHSYPVNYVPSDLSNLGWNQLGFCSIYYTQNKINKQPTQYGQLINIPADENNESTQLWIKQASGTLFSRGGNGNSRVNDTAFKQFATLDDVGEAEKVDSQGTNWIRYKSGLQMCWNSSLKNTLTWTFPVPFSVTPVVEAIALPDNGNAYQLNSISNTSCAVYQGNENYEKDYRSSVLAVGRWK